MADDFALAGPARKGGPTLDDEGVPRDRWNRYVLPDPEHPGTDRVFTRTTTLTRMVDDDYLLQLWKQRNVAFGLSRTPDLLATAAAAEIEDKATLNQVCEDAAEAAGANRRRRLGSAIHKFCERLDLGESASCPPAWLAEVAAYRHLVGTSGINFPHGYIERVVINPAVEAAGKPDRVGILTRDLTVRYPDGGTVTLRKGEAVIVDLKTGSDIRFGQGAIAAQLAVYSRATHMWIKGTRTLTPMVPVNQHVGLIIHLPVRDAPDQVVRATLHAVNLDQGWQAAQIAYSLRRWRTETKKSVMSDALDLDPDPVAVVDTVAVAERAALEVCMTHPSAPSDVVTDAYEQLNAVCTLTTPAGAPCVVRGPHSLHLDGKDSTRTVREALDGQKCINCDRPWKGGKITHARGCPESRRRSRKVTETPAVDSAPPVVAPERSDMVVRQLTLCPQCEAPVDVKGTLCGPCAEVQRGMLPDTEIRDSVSESLSQDPVETPPFELPATDPWTDTPLFLSFPELLEQGRWLEAIRIADHNGHLSQVFKAASAAGEWTDTLLSAGKQRQADGFK